MGTRMGKMLERIEVEGGVVAGVPFAAQQLVAAVGLGGPPTSSQYPKICDKQKYLKHGHASVKLTENKQKPQRSKKNTRTTQTVREITAKQSRNPSRNASIQGPTPTYDNLTDNALPQSNDPPYHYQLRAASLINRRAKEPQRQQPSDAASEYTNRRNTRFKRHYIAILQDEL
ncbi:hypothetical protein RF55_15338 [Lasius niger]|uniref:Uncharacterized protein n=1 Tax=Lasius niger TaxID=67767 RepID=A0A0J7K5U6_LASNI|nr:hypothetical protein RF55_15338 [Lasius niger]